MATESLKPCPFCGGRALVIVWKGEERMVRVECMECKCSTPGVVFSLPCTQERVRELGWQPDLETAKNAAVDAWNQRA